MKRFLSIVALVAILISMFPVTRESDAAQVGTSGSIAPGGVPGKGGGIVGWGYRVGLVSETMKSGLEIDPYEDNQLIITKIKKQYNNHFPSMANSLIYVPTSEYNSNFVLGYYTPSSGNIQYIGNEIADKKLQKLTNDFPSTADDFKRISYNKLAAKAPFSQMGKKDNAGRQNTMKTLLGDGKWKSLAPTPAQAKQVWNYLLSSQNNIDKRIKDYIREDNLNLPNLPGNDALKYEAKLSYLDLLMTIYSASEGIKDQQDFYASEIDRYIEEGASLSTKPVMLAIDTVVAFTYPSKLGSTWLYVPSTAYVEYAHGGVPAQSIISPDFNGGNAVSGGTKGIIALAAKNSIAALKTRSRLTDLRDEAYKNNGLMWGYGGVVGAILRTTSSGSVTWAATSSTNPIMEGLPFDGDMYGFMIAGASHNRPSIDCKCQSRLSTTEKGGVVEGETIGKQVPLAVDLSVAAEEYTKWERYLKQSKSQMITIKLTRTGGSGAGAFSPYDNGAVALNSAQTVSATQLLNWLKESTQGPVYQDDLRDYPIAEGSSVKFTYKAEVEITVVAADGSTESIACDASPEKSITFSRDKHKPQTASYKSRPSYWSEIKQGTPYNETFEAMAGTVTTRPLYFASGGSEFIVDIEVEYVPDGTATRTYTSKFNAVPSGWNMEPKIGSVSHGKEPAPPEARTQKDVSGEPYTEIVTPHSEKHTTKPAVPCSGDPCTGGSPEEWHTDYWFVQEGYNKTVGGYSDTWTQTSTFDYIKINKVHVWKLDKSKLSGMGELIGTDEVTATIKQGDPTIFANIASSNTSTAGRLRYSLETDKHDHVVWDEGDSDNRDANSDSDDYVNEKKKFKERRELTTNVTAISDFLILQTSSGDQSVIYFQKTSNTAKTTEPLTVPKTSKEEMWDNNSDSAAKWTVDQIHIGSYNGQYYSPMTKYNGSGNGGTVATIFDSMPAGLTRTPRPTGPLRLMQTDLDIIDTYPNGEYLTGDATVFYRHLSFQKGTNDSEFSSTTDSLYGAAGQSFLSTYSPAHSKVNNIVIHNPVSAENAMVIPLPASRDQRTPLTRSIGGNLQTDIVEFDRTLDPNWRPNLLFNGNAELTDSAGLPVGWTPITNTPTAVAFETERGSAVIAGQKSFGINTLAKTGTSNYGAQFYQIVDISPNTNYEFKGKLDCLRCTGYFYLYEYDAANQVVASRNLSTTNTVNHAEKVLTFKSNATAVKLRIELLKGNSIAENAAQRDYYYADDISLINKDSATADKPIGFKEVQVPNPDYTPVVPVDEKFSYTGSTQTWTAPANGTYQLEVWGAEGGTSGYGGKGGYSKGNINLSKGEILYINIGGSTGWNGGGSGHGRATDSGGGGTDIRKDGNSLHERVIVAGGGGGYGGGARPGGAGGGTTGYAGTDGYGSPGSGGTQTYGGAGGSNYGGDGLFGVGGSNITGSNSGGGGGGGGWYGGGAGGNDYSSYNDLDDSGGGGGSGYIGETISAGSLYGGNSSMPAPGSGTETGHSGNGFARIKTDVTLQTPTPRFISEWVNDPDYVPDVPSEAYIMTPITTPPDKPITIPGGGTYSPGNFINLDYEFTIYFPNVGDFRGDDAWGIGQTTATRGKGFTSPMDTTEWTRSKSVTFDFDVIYNGRMYLSREEIDLPVDCNSFHCQYAFYAPLDNSEAISALVTFKSIAINGISLDNDNPTNRIRYSRLDAKHSAVKYSNVDVVGRIGNLVIEDTGDFRFSNLFKNPIYPAEWLVPNVVKKVNVNSQNQIVGDTIDIRGLTASPFTHFLDTYGKTAHMNRQPIALPLSPEKNNIAALKKQPLRVGYNVLADLQTIGNYYNSVQIIPYYYHLNLQNGVFTPVDIYMTVDSMYQPINIFGAAVPGWDPSIVYPYSYVLDWDGESGRRNYSSAEQANTMNVIEYYKSVDDGNVEHKMNSPYGDSFPFGTAQIMYLQERNRTFTGSPATYGDDKNPGSRRDQEEFGKQGQRWHFTYGLPSSAVAVEHGRSPTQDNIDQLKNNTSVLVMTADIVSIGDTYALKYGTIGTNNRLQISGTDFSTASLPYPVVAVYSATKSSADDLRVTGTH